MNVLGIHCAFSHLNHDPSAALICDGKLIALGEEERFTRIKGARGLLPFFSIRFCLKQAGLKMEDIDLVVSTGETIKEQLDNNVKLFFKHYFGVVPPIQYINHQFSHLASAFFYSGFDRSMCISYDGRGDDLSGMLAVGSSKGIKVLEKMPIKDSVGLFYCAVTQFLGFRQAQDEYKVMGLASFGKEGEDISSLVRISDDGYSVRQENFGHPFPIRTLDEPIYNENLIRALGTPRRFGEPITDRHRNLAFAVQRSLEECVVRLVKRLHAKTGLDSLCIAGGVGLNCSANRIIHQLPFIKRLFVQPAASDRGLCLGNALVGAYENGEKIELPGHVFFGPSYTNGQLLSALKLTGQDYIELPDPGTKAAEMLAEGKIIGWFQGRSEFGPRALGNRSILADPRSIKMKDEINARIKFREEFRPFAPAVLEERASEVFEMDQPSPYMTVTFTVRPHWVEKLQAVTHVDKTARVQTVSKETNPLFHGLIAAFGRLTGVPVVLNTSFNARGEPIVETPLDALATFSSVGMDALFLGPYLITKPKPPRR
ncbi:MAG: carbamoyltransferase C-terminal domain-containing protein [Candidatus Omnitrophota bacterium]|nr:carbamoyltransferase C-terminal domain-containing protein [Candidatus Omnitrophota bacterium]